MLYTVLFIVVALVVLALWELVAQKGSSKLFKENTRLPSQIKKSQENIDKRSGSWERKLKSESRRLKPFVKQKKKLEDQLKKKVDTWLDDEMDRPFFNP